MPPPDVLMPPPDVLMPPPDVLRPPPVGLSLPPPPPSASFFGLRSRTLMFLFLDFDIFCFLIYGLMFVFVSSATPNNNFRPPVTFCFGIRSSRRISLSFPRLGRRLVGSAALAFFLFFGALTSPALIPAFVPQKFLSQKTDIDAI